MTTEPSDIVERLLDVADLDARAGEPLGKACREAAAEITRLRAALAERTEECARVAESIERVPVDYPVTGLVDPHEPTRRGIAAAIRDLGS